MWQQILELALTNGLWSALFVGLFVYQLRDSARREKKYLATIQELSVSLKTVKHLEKDINLMGRDIAKIKKVVTNVEG